MTSKPARDLTLEERAAACVFTVEEEDGTVRYVNGVTGQEITPDTPVPVPGGRTP